MGDFLLELQYWPILGAISRRTKLASFAGHLVQHTAKGFHEATCCFTILKVYRRHPDKKAAYAPGVRKTIVMAAAIFGRLNLHLLAHRQTNCNLATISSLIENISLSPNNKRLYRPDTLASCNPDFPIFKACYYIKMLVRGEGILSYFCIRVCHFRVPNHIL